MNVVHIMNGNDYLKLKPLNSVREDTMPELPNFTIEELEDNS